jgi:hypothetical protein
MEEVWVFIFLTNYNKWDSILSTNAQQLRFQ